MTTDLDARGAEHLLRADGQEDVCLALYRPSTGSRRTTALLADLVLPLPGERTVHGTASFQGSYVVRAASLAAANDLGVALLHSHPGGIGWQGMSGVDRDTERSYAHVAEIITGHPLEKYQDKIEAFRALSTADISALKNSTGKDEVYAAGVIANLRVLKSKKGDFYAQANFEDMSGSVDMLVFPEAFRRLQEKVKLEIPVLIRGGVRVEEGSNPKLTVSDIISLEEAKPKLPRSIRIRVPLETATDGTVEALHTLFAQNKGEAKVLFDVERQGDVMVVMEAYDYNVQPDRNFIARVEDLSGRGAVRIID